MRRLVALSMVALAWDGAQLRAANDDVDLRMIDQIKVGGSGGWDYVTLDPIRHVIYLSHGSSIASVDTLSGRIIPRLAESDGSHVALPIDDGKHLLITNGKSNRITINDAQTGALLSSIDADAGPDAAVLDPDTGRAFVMANHGMTVDVIDLKDHSIVARIAMNGSPEAAAVDGHGRVFTHLEDKDSIASIDARQARVTSTYAMPDCKEPSGIAFDPVDDTILSACGNGIARLTDARTGAEVASLPIGQRPDFALVDARRRLGFIPCGDGTLSVIHLQGRQSRIVQVVTTRAGARTAALDATTGRLYLPTADLTPPPAPGQRPGIVPDTFEVLVVGPSNPNPH